MSSALSTVLRSPRFAPLPESVTAALHLLADDSPGWQELAGVAARDPAFAHALLAAAPLAREEHGQPLAPVLARRLEGLGSDVLRAWLLDTEPPPAHARLRERILAHSVLTAACARLLAVEMGYPRPEEAYLAGLWHDLGRLCLLAAPDYAEYATALPTEAALATEERKHYGQDHAAMAARLAAAGGAAIHVADAIALHHIREEQAAAAHPLARLLWAAEALVSPEHELLLDAIARVTGLTETTLITLRGDAAALVSGSSRDAGSPFPPPEETSTDPERVSPPSGYWRDVTLSGLLRGSFGGLAPEAAGSRLDMACRLLFGRPRPFIVSIEPDGQLIAVPLPGGEDRGRLFDELGLRLDDKGSAVAQAARGSATTRHFADPDDPNGSPQDWHLARWLEAPGFLCLPCQSGQERFVAVFGIEEDGDSAGAKQATMGLLAASAGAVLVSKIHRDAAEAALVANLEQRYREHARRIVHEVNNPLAVIRSYLGMIAQRFDAHAELRTELDILNQELDRVASLLQAVTKTPRAAPESLRSNVADVLQELRALYGVPLFARRNIEFDIRTAPNLPPASMPPSALKQVLLNLLRNASEAMVEGGKLSISTPGTLLANGIPCVEIRLIDNGPGIPPERFAHLFEPRPSQKPGHQGVGLSICRELLSAWGASIVCRSQAGAGTSFQIFIPLDQQT